MVVGVHVPGDGDVLGAVVAVGAAGTDSLEGFSGFFLDRRQFRFGPGFVAFHGGQGGGHVFLGTEAHEGNGNVPVVPQEAEGGFHGAFPRPHDKAKAFRVIGDNAAPQGVHHHRPQFFCPDCVKGLFPGFKVVRRIAQEHSLEDSFHKEGFNLVLNEVAGNADVPDKSFVFKFAEGVKDPVPFPAFPVFQARDTPHMVKVDGGDVEPFKLGVDFPAYGVFGGLEGFGRHVVGQLPPPQFREALAKDRFAFDVKVGRGGVKVGNAPQGGLDHHGRAFIVIVDAGKAHAPKTQKGNLFPRGAVVPVNHTDLLLPFNALLPR